MRIERTIAAAVLALGLSALLYAQAPGLFSDLDVDGTFTMAVGDQIGQFEIGPAAVGQGELKTSTGTSTGTGVREVALPGAFTFWPALAGSPLCELTGVTNGWSVRTGAVPNRFGEFALPPDLIGAPQGITAVGSDLWVVGNNNVFQVPQGNPSTGTEFDLPAGVAQGITAVGSDLWVADMGQPSVWRVTQATPGTGTEFTLPTGFSFSVGGITAVGSDLWAVDRSGRSVYQVPQSNPSTGTEFSLPPGLTNPFGIASSGSDLWVADAGLPVSVWRVTQATPGTGTEFTLPTGFGLPHGVTAVGSDLWVVDGVAPGSVWRVPQSNPGLGECAPPRRPVTWRYVTASDNPHVSVRRTTAGAVVALWQSEDPPMNQPALGVSPWETTTDTVVSTGPPPTATLASALRGHRRRRQDRRAPGPQRLREQPRVAVRRLGRRRHRERP